MVRSPLRPLLDKAAGTIDRDQLEKLAKGRGQNQRPELHRTRAAKVLREIDSGPTFWNGLLQPQAL